MKEFGGAVQVSKEFHDLDTEGSLALTKDTLKREFDQYKEKHFPTWDGQFRFLEGPLLTENTIARVDGEEVPDEILDQYIDWTFDEEATTWPFGHEYEQKPVYYYQFGWYAAVPDELVVNA